MLCNIYNKMHNKIYNEILYKIYDETNDIYYYDLTISQIILLIKSNNNHKNIYYKFINNNNIINNYNNDNNTEIKIKINNDIVLNTEFICHRINSINELNDINIFFGTEIDIRDDHKTDKLILSHDPFVKGDYLESYLQNYHHNTLILNIKSERVELKCLELLKKYNINNYFFLDSSFPMIYLLNNEYNNNNIACRFSEFEPIEQFIKINHMVKYVWIDCFNIFPLNNEIYNIIKSYNKKICIVSPELQKQPDKIELYRNYMINNNIIPDLICCKSYNIIHWI